MKGIPKASLGGKGLNEDKVRGKFEQAVGIDAGAEYHGSTENGSGLQIMPLRLGL